MQLGYFFLGTDSLAEELSMLDGTVATAVPVIASSAGVVGGGVAAGSGLQVV